MNTNQVTVHNLRKQGFKVRVIHSRYFKDSEFPSTYSEIPPRLYQFFDPKGGATKIEVRKPDGTEVTATAICSRKDAFNRKRGLAIALGRLSL